MNTITQAFDSRAMPLLSEPSTAPSAFSLWRWLGDRLAAKAQATALRDGVAAPARPSDLDPPHADRGQR